MTSRMTKALALTALLCGGAWGATCDDFVDLDVEGEPVEDVWECFFEENNHEGEKP